MSFAQYPSLQDRVVLITGGGSGIGGSMTEAFAGQGARVAFVDIDEKASTALAERLSGARHKPLFIRADVTDIGVLKQAIARIRNEAGPIAVLVNNAANDERHKVDAVTPEYWDGSINVNLRHQFFAAQAVHPQMRELGYGSIINLTSTAWMFGGGDFTIYSTAKAGVVGLTNALARAFGGDAIRVNAIAPGAVMTEKQLRLWYTEETADAMAERQMIKKRLLPEDVARMALFLAADDSRMITKQCILVDAGIR